ncbi:hypothetical protein [Nocardia sp. CA-145437]|uniref:hypothetical protein n=1 Tax=Nocardia sp. CA-145437 TaxID=3239980 RepID=UPI003D98D446
MMAVVAHSDVSITDDTRGTTAHAAAALGSVWALSPMNAAVHPAVIANRRALRRAAGAW